MKVHDGANCVLIGHLGAKEKALAIVGGNCSLQGFDHEGNDAYWTVSIFLYSVLYVNHIFYC